MGLFSPKWLAEKRIRAAFAFLLVMVCCAFLLAGCAKEDESKLAKPEEFVGIWEPSQLELGGKPYDLSKASFKIELNDDMSGTLTAGTEEQNVQWEIRGFKGEYVDVHIVVTLEKRFPLGGVNVDLKGFNFIYSTEDESLSFEQSWHGEVNGMEARFTLSGTMQRAQ